jgi:hypothetical protein
MPITLSDLQKRKTVLEHKVEELVTQLRAGTLNESDMTALRDLSDDIARVRKAIAIAEEQVDLEKTRQAAIANQEQAFKFESALSKLESTRSKVLTLYRALSISLGDFCQASTDASVSAPKSLLPHEQHRLRSLALNESILLGTIADTFPFVDGNWRTGFAVTPRKT